MSGVGGLDELYGAYGFVIPGSGQVLPFLLLCIVSCS